MQIQRRVLSGSEENSGFNELASVLAAAPTLETYRAIYDQVLAAYDFRCALTGQQFERLPGKVHPFLRLVAIWPREAGGPLHIGNYLPLCADAADAFRLGHFIVDDGLHVVADRTVMSPRLFARLLPYGYLLAPRDPLFAPDRTVLAQHRRAVIQR